MASNLEKVLSRVQKPARYTGGEYGAVIKNVSDVKIRYAFCFPDVYEVGMSHLGLRILYHLINERSDTYCERVFTPWPDMCEEMTRENIPLFTLETGDYVKNFDFLGITLQYEMCYTNILKVFDLAGIPRRSRDRGEGDVFVCGGGPCAYNPEPLAEFFDFFVLGEGEEVTNEYLDVYLKCREKGYKRNEILREISKIDGIYVPSYYDVKFEGPMIKSFEPKYDHAPKKVKKRIINDLDKSYFPDTIIMPFMEIVHDRASLEVFRGCIRGCRFCQAGNIYRPVREHSPKRLLQIAESLTKNSGYDEISLLSLSTSDYTCLPELTKELIEITEDRKISLSLPSLRIDNFTMELLSRIQKVRKSTLTFAPEAGTQKMRDIINKGITEEEILQSARLAFKGGYQNIKLYFMIGLPYETLEDVAGIPRLAQRILDVFHDIPREKQNKSVSLTASVSCFVPKPFTPFQWAAQDTIPQFKEKQRVLVETPRSKRIKINYHDPKLSILEGVFARGDRRLCAVLEKAVDMGCVFDGWSEFFDYDKWAAAFSHCNLNIEMFTRERSYDEILPWDIIDIGVSKKHLMRENERAKKAELTPHCRQKCTGCGAAEWKVGVCCE
jgi:radical SAM family uncharacterized protein